jgi:hypothetical protein
MGSTPDVVARAWDDVRGVRLVVGRLSLARSRAADAPSATLDVDGAALQSMEVATSAIKSQIPHGVKI